MRNIDSLVANFLKIVSSCISHPLVVIIAATIAMSMAPNSDLSKKSGLKGTWKTGLKNLRQTLFKQEDRDIIITISDSIYITRNQDFKE